MMDPRSPSQRRHDQRQAQADERRGRGRWPIAGDKPVDAARTIAGQLLRIIEAADDIEQARDQAASVVAKARGWGQLWLNATDTAPDGPWWTREQVAALAHVTPNAVTNWTSRDQLVKHPQGYAEREVMDFLAARRRAGTPTADAAQGERHVA